MGCCSLGYDSLLTSTFLKLSKYVRMEENFAHCGQPPWQLFSCLSRERRKWLWGKHGALMAGVNLVHKLDQISWLPLSFYTLPRRVRPTLPFVAEQNVYGRKLFLPPPLPSLPKRVWLMMGSELAAARGSSRNDNNICQRSIRSISNP